MDAPRAEETEGAGVSPDDASARAAGPVSQSGHRRISLSSGPTKNPAPPPPSPQFQLLLLRLLAVTVIALLWELLAARWSGSVSFNGKRRLASLLLFFCFLALLMGKAAGEERLAVTVHRKLREKLDDSFKGGQSAVKGAWIRLGFATQVGFGLTVSPPPSTTAAAGTAAAVPSKEGSGGGATAAEAGLASGNRATADHLLAVRGLT